MRIQHWLTAIVCGLLILSAPSARAQYPMPMDGPYSQPPGAGAMMPYGGGNVGQIWPQQTPQHFYPYPAISPYATGNVGMDQSYMRDGLWFRRIVNQRRDYYFSLEATYVKFRDPGSALIGSPHAEFSLETRDIRGVPISARERILGAIPDDTLAGFLQADPRVFPIPLVDLPVVVDSAIFPIRSMDTLNQVNTTGILGRWGYENEDGTGLNWNVHWAFDQSTNFQLGSDNVNGIPITPAVTAALDGRNLFTKRGAIPLDNGELFPEPLFGTGSTAKYDVLFQLSHSTEMGGTNLSFYSTPIVQHDSITIRPLWGLRYTYLGEQFRFRGIDSGFDYGIDNGVDGDGTFRPEPGSLVQLYPQYEARLKSAVQSHIAGPEIGLRIDLGEGDSFHIWGETIGGLAANAERIQVQGENIGDPLYDAQVLLLQLPLGTVPRMFTNPTQFNDIEHHTHVSPIFSQSVNADIGILDYVPVINRMSIFEGAKFRMGYQFLAIGRVARPGDSIDWKGFPLFPSASAGYRTWYSHQFNFGVNWEY